MLTSIGGSSPGVGRPTKAVGQASARDSCSKTRAPLCHPINHDIRTTFANCVHMHFQSHRFKQLSLDQQDCAHSVDKKSWDAKCSVWFAFRHTPLVQNPNNPGPIDSAARLHARSTWQRLRRPKGHRKQRKSSTATLSGGNRHPKRSAGTLGVWLPVFCNVICVGGGAEPLSIYSSNSLLGTARALGRYIRTCGT